MQTSSIASYRTSDEKGSVAVWKRPRPFPIAVGAIAGAVSAATYTEMSAWFPMWLLAVAALWFAIGSRICSGGKAV